MTHLRLAVSLLGLVAGMPQIALADQCAALSKAQAAAAASELRRAKAYFEFCEPCGDKAPGPVVRLGWLGVKKEGDAYSLEIDYKPKDIAYLFTEVSPGRLANLAATSGCPTQSVSATIWSGRPNLCREREQVVFTCTTTRGKVLSLCGVKGLIKPFGTLHYRYGAPEMVELTISDSTGANSKFSKMDDAHKQGFENGINVTNGGHAYYVVARGGDMGDFVGVEITPPQGSAISIECEKGAGGFEAFEAASASLPSR